MKARFLSVTAAFAAFASLAFGDVPPTWSEEIESSQGRYSVSVMSEQKKVEVKKLDGAGGPPHLRIRVLRPNDRPLEIRLRTLEKPNSGALYTGNLNQWNDSYAGLEIDFSFDKKTWKRLGNMFRKRLPVDKK